MGLIVACFAFSGAALIQLRPRNAIGWILVCSGLLQVTNLAADAYSTRALTDPDQSLPLGLAAAWVASWTWFPSLMLPAIVLPPLYPTGPSGFRVLVVACAASLYWGSCWPCWQWRPLPGASPTQ